MLPGWRRLAVLLTTGESLLKVEFDVNTMSKGVAISDFRVLYAILDFLIVPGASTKFGRFKQCSKLLKVVERSGTLLGSTQHRLKPPNFI
jgi:hypothetical protein